MAEDEWIQVVAEAPDPAGRARARRVAVSLMRLALPLLERAGDTSAAARLRHVVDDAERRGPGSDPV